LHGTKQAFLTGPKVPLLLRVQVHWGQLLSKGYWGLPLGAKDPGSTLTKFFSLGQLTNVTSSAYKRSRDILRNFVEEMGDNLGGPFHKK